MTPDFRADLTFTLQRSAIMQLNTNRTVFHISGYSLFKQSGFSQQFMMETKRLAQRGWNVHAISYCPINTYFDKKRVAETKKIYSDSQIRLTVFPSVLIGRPIIEFLYFPIAFLLLLLYSIKYRPIVYHVHNYYLAAFIIPLKFVFSARLFADLHGVVIEEFIFNKRIENKSFSHRYENLKEKLIFSFCDQIFCVSDNMIHFYQNKHHMPKDIFRLTRSSYDPDIFSYFNYEYKINCKSDIGFDGSLVMLYMGHKKGWQATKEVVDLFISLKYHLVNLKIIILSDDYINIESMLVDNGISSSEYFVGFVPHRDVPKYSYAADVAVIIRHDSIVNRAASPVKVSESLASGAILLINSFVGDLPNIAHKSKVTINIDKYTNNEIRQFLENELYGSSGRIEETAFRCRRFAEKHFSLERTISTFEGCYNE